MNYFMTLNQISALFLLIVVGFLVQRSRIVSDNFKSELSAFVFYVPLTCTIISSMMVEFSKETINQSLTLIAICFGVISFCILLSRFAPAIFREKDKTKVGVYEFSLAFSNYGFMGWPICGALFGSEGILFSAIYAIPIHIFYYGYGSIIFSKASTVDGKINLKNAITPPFIATMVGLFLVITKIPLPSQVLGTMEMLGACTTPLSMMVAGMLLGSQNFSLIFKNYKMLIVAFFRLIAIPLVVFFALRAFGFSGIVLAIPTIICAMPTSANMTVLTEKFGADSYLAAQSIFITTLLSILTIPFISMLVV